jgi:hypothetical protein
MKALTVRQPWATLIVAGFKQIETRTRDTKHRGTLAIHAGLAMPCKLGEIVHYGPDFWVERDRSGLLLRSTRMAWPYRLPLGAIVGSADLIYTRSTNSIECKPDDINRALGDFAPDRFAWYMTSANRLSRPISCNGALGLWNVPDHIAAQLEAVPA